VSTQGQLQQVMGHRDAGVYQAYINQRVQCDVQASFLGRPSATALFRAVSHMSRDVDPRAPNELSPPEVNALRIDPKIVRLQELRDRLSLEARGESGTLKRAEAKGTKIYQMYKRANDDLRSTKAQAVKSAKKTFRQQYFENIGTIEINKQLGVSRLDLSLLDLTKDDWEPEQANHDLEERTLVAKLICQDAHILSEQEKVDLRTNTTNALIALCRTREAPRRQKGNRVWGPRGTLGTVDTPSAPYKSEPFQLPTICSREQCMFCFYNTNEPMEVRLYEFSSQYKTRNHVERHLKLYQQDDKVPCPVPECHEVLDGHSHFKNHSAGNHEYDIFRRIC
jgi:hypothetical protein